MQPSVKKGENLHFFNFSEVGINGGKHRLNQCRNWGYYDGGLNANFGIRVNGKERKYQIETFNKEVIVSVTIDQFIRNNISNLMEYWAIVPIIAFIASVIGYLYRNRNKLKSLWKRR